MFRDLFVRYRLLRFYRTGIDRTRHSFPLTEEMPGERCEIVSITFNNPALTRMQVELARKHIKGNYRLVIADNSSDRIKRKEIEDICRKEKLSYISLPSNPFSTGSRSHAAAMNWVLRNYIEKIQPRYFGFIDHDIFPIESFDPAGFLNKQPVYGLLQERGPFWYLWAGFCFFNYDKVPVGAMDFMPGAVNGTRLDTGGKNWHCIYRSLDRSKLEFPAHSYTNLREGEVVQLDKLEIIGSCLHSFNGSYWMKVDPKEHLLDEYLDRYR